MQPLPLPPLPPRDVRSHKGDHGRVLIVAGCRAYPGAAVLAALGAGRAGAGLVHLALPRGIEPLVLPAVPFAILHALPAGAEGGFDATAAAPLLGLAGGMQAVVLGPGLGEAPGCAALVTSLLEGVRAPLVLDADGLNHLARSGLDALRRRPGPTVLTPHPGEFARLDPEGGVPTQEQRSARAEAFAARHGVVLVLKGHASVVTDGRRTRVEPAGNPGMAKGGMGDVLSGMLGALLAVLPDPAEAAALAVHLHAAAGDLAAAALGQASVLPTDVAEHFGRALDAWRAVGSPGARAPG